MTYLEPSPRFCAGVLTASLLALCPCLANARACPESIDGGWTTYLPVDQLFRTELVAPRAIDGDVELIRPPIRFVGKTRADTSDLQGFVYFAQNAYRVDLPRADDGSWSATWGPLPIALESVQLDVHFGDDGQGGTGAYFFFRDQRLPSLYGLSAECRGDAVTFSEVNLGLTFSGAFDHEASTLLTEAKGLGGVASLTWKRMSAEEQAQPAGSPTHPPRDPAHATITDRAPEATDDGWRTARPSKKGLDTAPLTELIKMVAAGELPLAHSVLVAKSGELIVEEYFYGFDRDTVHDMRSASKSIASILVGLAVDRGLIKGADAKALDFYEYPSYENWSDTKADITLRHLMTMSSGLDANDSDRNSAASENAYQWQRQQPDWIKFALDAPMIAKPGERVIYGSANPMILGGVLESATGGPVEWFADEALFKPLGVSNYRIAMTPMNAGAYLGGGMYMRPRDMLKIGQMYLDGGKWRGKQIVSESWVEDSLGKYGRLEPLDRNGNQYGYLWWHEVYEVGGRSIASIEARGNGGQYIFIVPELDVAAVITGGNYRGGLEMTRQSQRIFANYVLAALVGE